MLLATSEPFFVSFISLILPCFSNCTRSNLSKVCRILTAWLYVQSTSFARIEPYLALLNFFKATSIKAGFLLKNTSKLSFSFGVMLYVLQPIYSINYIAFKLFCGNVI